MSAGDAVVVEESLRLSRDSLLAARRALMTLTLQFASVDEDVSLDASVLAMSHVLNALGVLDDLRGSLP